MKFLIDECLSPQLVHMARAHEYEANHVTWLGKTGETDWGLMPEIVSNDWTFVTRNCRDFRGDGEGGLFAKEPIHAGLICLNAAVMTLVDQNELFEAALDEIGRDPDLVNMVLELTLEEGNIHFLRYALPKS